MTEESKQSEISYTIMRLIGEKVLVVLKKDFPTAQGDRPAMFNSYLLDFADDEFVVLGNNPDDIVAIIALSEISSIMIDNSSIDEIYSLKDMEPVGSA